MSRRTSAPTLDEIRKWPATVSVTEAATALGVSRAALYARIADGTTPVGVVRIGERRVRVVTESLIARLEKRTAHGDGR